MIKNLAWLHRLSILLATSLHFPSATFQMFAMEDLIPSGNLYHGLQKILFQTPGNIET